MNTASWIILSVVGIGLAAALVSILKNRRSAGCSGCSLQNSCPKSGCGRQDDCHPKQHTGRTRPAE